MKSLAWHCLSFCCRESKRHFPHVCCFSIIEKINEWDLCPHGWGLELGVEHHDRPLAINECKYVHNEPKQEDNKKNKNKKKEQGDQFQRKRPFLWGVHHISDAEDLYGLE
jgi:hypothetical protein